MKRKNRANFRERGVTFRPVAVDRDEKMVASSLEPVGYGAALGQRLDVDEVLAKPKREVDAPGVPEVGSEFWKDAVQGRLYRPVKQAVSLRLDADVIVWLKKGGAGYQTRANRVLRERMLKDLGEGLG